MIGSNMPNQAGHVGLGFLGLCACVKLDVNMLVVQCTGVSTCASGMHARPVKCVSEHSWNVRAAQKIWVLPFTYLRVGDLGMPAGVWLCVCAGCWQGSRVDVTE